MRGSRWWWGSGDARLALRWVSAAGMHEVQDVLGLRDRPDVIVGSELSLAARTAAGAAGNSSSAGSSAGVLFESNGMIILSGPPTGLDQITRNTQSFSLSPLRTIAAERGVPPGQVALALAARRPGGRLPDRGRDQDRSPRRCDRILKSHSPQTRRTQQAGGAHRPHRVLGHPG